MGNLNQIQVGILAAMIGLVYRPLFSRDFILALLVGLACLVKPNFSYAALLLPIYWGVQRKWNRLIPYTAGISLATLIGYFVLLHLFGPACTWKQWFLGHSEIIYTNQYLSASLLGKLTQTTDLKKFSIWAGVFFLLTTDYVIYIAKRSVSNNRINPKLTSEVCLLGMGISAFLLASPINHTQDFLLMFPWGLLIMSPQPCSAGDIFNNR